MPRRSPLAIGRVVGGLARLSPRRHRDLVQGMVAELDSIIHPSERIRFGLGAIAAIVRLALGEYARALVRAPGRFLGVTEPDDGSNPGGPSMSQPTTRQLLLRHAVPFAVSLTSLTGFLLAAQAMRRIPRLSEQGMPAGSIAEVLLLSVPHTLALTIPMAVFLAVAWVFMRLGAEGVLASARRRRHGLRHLVAPVLAAASVVAALTFVSNTQVIPRTNTRLAVALGGAPQALSDRMMTLGQLRDAARSARETAGPGATARAAAYEVEIQKKLALAAACLVLALAGMATGLRFPRGGVGLILAASALVFTGYYVSFVAGESLADRLVISPFLAMWMANAILLALVALLVWRPGRAGPTGGTETLAIGR